MSQMAPDSDPLRFNKALRLNDPLVDATAFGFVNRVHPELVRSIDLPRNRFDWLAVLLLCSIIVDDAVVALNDELLVEANVLLLQFTDNV